MRAGARCGSAHAADTAHPSGAGAANTFVPVSFYFHANMSTLSYLCLFTFINSVRFLAEFGDGIDGALYRNKQKKGPLGPTQLRAVQQAALLVVAVLELAVAVLFQHGVAGVVRGVAGRVSAAVRAGRRASRHVGPAIGVLAGRAVRAVRAGVRVPNAVGVWRRRRRAQHPAHVELVVVMAARLVRPAEQRGSY
jgi:hypothetical protein